MRLQSVRAFVRRRASCAAEAMLAWLIVARSCTYLWMLLFMLLFLLLLW